MTSLRKLRAREDEASLWMLPYSTLMLVLMIFFAAFYGLSYQQSVEYETAIAELESTDPAVKESMIKQEVSLAKSLQEFIEDKRMTDLAEIKITALYIKMKLSSPVLFDSAAAELKPGIFPLFEQLLTRLKDMKNLIIVEGHTDNIPIHSHLYRSNWELSAARAFSVIYFFINKGIAPERLVAHGFGEFRPAFSNGTEIGRAKNRRIEITIVRGGPGR